MVWVDTGRVVAGVQDLFTCRVFACSKLPRYAMGIIGLAVNAESSVAVEQFVSRPFPTSVCFVDFFPESCFFGAQVMHDAIVAYVIGLSRL